MNNGNGHALLGRIRPGMLVTVRTPTGSQLTGRASRDPGSTVYYLVGVTGTRYTIAPENVIRVTP